MNVPSLPGCVEIIQENVFASRLPRLLAVVTWGNLFHSAKSLFSHL